MEKREESNILAEKKNIDLSVRILLLVVLFAWCMMIILPFVIPVLWGLILSITLYPLYKGLLNLLKGKKILAESGLNIVAADGMADAAQKIVKAVTA